MKTINNFSINFGTQHSQYGGWLNVQEVTLNESIRLADISRGPNILADMAQVGAGGGGQSARRQIDWDTGVKMTDNKVWSSGRFFSAHWLVPFLSHQEAPITNLARC